MLGAVVVITFITLDSNEETPRILKPHCLFKLVNAHFVGQNGLLYQNFVLTTDYWFILDEKGTGEWTCEKICSSGWKMQNIRELMEYKIFATLMKRHPTYDLWQIICKPMYYMRTHSFFRNQGTEKTLIVRLECNLMGRTYCFLLAM